MISSFFDYGTGRGSAVDDILADAAAPPEKGAQAKAKWGLVCAQAACYRAWASAVASPPEAYEAGSLIQSLAQAALSGLPAVRRPAILAEALDSAIVSGNPPAIAWLLSQGAPRSPVLWVRGSRMESFGVHADHAMLRQSWCALAARSKKFESLAALEACGIGKQDREGPFAVMEKEGLASMFSCHPWVAACSFDSARARPSEMKLAAQAAKLWKPGPGRSRDLCMDALADSACGEWSAKAALTLASLRCPIGEELGTSLSASLISAFDDSAKPWSGQDGADFARAGMAWSVACSGPTLEAVAEKMLAEFEEEASSFQWSEASRRAAGLGSMAKMAMEAHGGWGQLPMETARKASAAMAAAMASAPPGAVGGLRDAMETAMLALDALAGPDMGVRAAGPKRM